MPHSRFVVSLRAFAGVAGVFALMSLGCTDDRLHTDPEIDGRLPLDEAEGEAAPVDLTYICGNRFVVTNSYDVPITVTYRVESADAERRETRATVTVRNQAGATCAVATHIMRWVANR